MLRLQTCRATMISFAVAGLFPISALAATSHPDCDVSPPMADEKAADVAGSKSVPTLTQRLATCGSVLDPPAVGDPDIVEPTPKTRDPINIHPETPQGKRP